MTKSDITSPFKLHVPVADRDDSILTLHICMYSYKGMVEVMLFFYIDILIITNIILHVSVFGSMVSG